MKLVVFGLTVSSSWGNGHATLWRGLIRALERRGHDVVFFERDQPFYAEHRDLYDLGEAELVFYADWESVRLKAMGHLLEADVAMVTSYCPDATAAADLVRDQADVSVFYDLDTPVTFARLAAGERVDYLPSGGLADFDLVLSYTGGGALTALRERLGARLALPLYGHVDAEAHGPAAPDAGLACDLSYLGTYAADRQAGVEALFVEAARRRPDRRFRLAGSGYPRDFPWTDNIWFMRHLAPPEHNAFFASSRLTLNVTRRDMAAMGWCPSGRLFEAAACGAPVLSDVWPGLDQFFEPGREILLARTTEEALQALDLPDGELRRIAAAARERVLDEHTSNHRAGQLLDMLALACERKTGAWATPAGVGAPGVGGRLAIWGIVPAAGQGARIQPLAFSKELLPVGVRLDGGVERPRAVSEYLVERLARAGATKLCFVIAPAKSDILRYYGARVSGMDVAYVVQPQAAGLCDAIFRAAPLVHPKEAVAVGLPDTIWFPDDGLKRLPADRLAFLLFPVATPELFDAVVTDAQGRVREIQVKSASPTSAWVWGAFRMPGGVFHALHALWRARNEADEYLGTLVNAWIAQGGEAVGVRAGEAYVDVGTVHGYREALRLLSGARSEAESETRSRGP